MKKIAFILCACLFAISVQAQEETTHLKFMGIELNKNITNFETKLLVKGVTISKKKDLYPKGIRAYDGKFAGENAEILVWYNTHSRKVYRAKAIISRQGKFLMNQLRTSLENKLDKKYGADRKTTNNVKDESLREVVSYSVGNGTIELSVESNGYGSESFFYLHIDYKDSINFAENTVDELFGS